MGRETCQARIPCMQGNWAFIRPGLDAVCEVKTHPLVSRISASKLRGDKKKIRGAEVKLRFAARASFLQGCGSALGSPLRQAPLYLGTGYLSRPSVVVVELPLLATGGGGRTTLTLTLTLAMSSRSSRSNCRSNCRSQSKRRVSRATRSGATLNPPSLPPHPIYTTPRDRGIDKESRQKLQETEEEKFR